MRLLYSIRNEYEIYSRGLETDVYSDELFALLVLKNVFPKEFAELESDRGYLYRILNKREELVKEYQEVLREKIKEKEDIRNQVVSNYSDFLASNIPTGRVRIRTNESIGQFMYNWSRNKDSYKQIYFDNINNSYTFSTFIDKLCDIEPNLKERLEQIDYGDLDQRIESLNEEIIDLERDISKRQTSKTSELLLELGEDSLREYFEEENDEFKEIIENHYFPLIKVLMLSGLIDENYWRYKSYFHEGYLGPNDNVFINRVLTGKAIKNSFKLDNPSTVISYFEDIDYQRKDIVNYDLIDELIYQQKENPLIYILKNIKDNDDKEAINYINLFEYDKLKNVMEIILSHGFTDFFEFFSTVDLPKELKLKLTGLACENQDLEPNSDFIDYVSRNSEILELDYIKRKDLMLKTLVKSGIKFKDIKNLNVQSDIYKFIADNKMFIMNLDNLIKLSNELLVEGNRSEQDSLIRLFYLLSKNTNETLKEYTEENLEDIISQFLDRIEKQKIKSNSGEKGFLNILNSDLSNEIKVRLIKSEISNISDLKDVQSIELWVELFKCDLIKPTQENLMIYFNKTNEVYSIIDYLNKNYKVEFDLTQEMYRQIINSNKTDFKLFNLIKDKITELLDAIDPEIGIEKLKLLISSNLIECNIKNLIHIINTNNNPIILDFIKMSHNIDKLVDIVDLLTGPDILELLSVSLIEDLLKYKLFDDNQNIKLLQAFNKEISLFNITGATKETRIFVFNNYFDDDDIMNIISEHKAFDLWDEFILKLNKSDEVVDKISLKSMPKDFIDRIIIDDNLYESVKIPILKVNILGRNYPKKWQSWISSIESVKSISCVFNNEKPILENKYQADIAMALKEIGVISIDDNHRLHFRPKKYKSIAC